MQATYTLEQIPRPPDRDTWLRSRHGYWNASSAATLTATHPYQSLTDEISRKARPWAPTPDNVAMRRRNHLEAGWGTQPDARHETPGADTHPTHSSRSNGHTAAQKSTHKQK